MAVISTTHDVNFTTEVGDVVASGGRLNVSTDGVIINTSVTGGGFDQIGGPNGGPAVSINTILNDQIINSGAPAGTTTAWELIGPRGVASNTLVTANTIQLVFGDEVVVGGVPAATAINTSVTFNGAVLVASGGITKGATLTGLNPSFHANEFVFSGGSALNTIVNHDGLLDVGGDGFGGAFPSPFGGHFSFNEGSGFASNTIVNQFGTILVNDFSSTTSTTVFAGGQELVFNRGNVSNTTLIGGLEVIEGSATGFASGFASGTNITANGVQ